MQKSFARFLAKACLAAMVIATVLVGEPTQAMPHPEDGPDSIDARGKDVGKYYFWKEGWKDYRPLDPPKGLATNYSHLNGNDQERLRRACMNRRRFCQDFYFGYDTRKHVLRCFTSNELQHFLNRKSAVRSVANEVGLGVYGAATEAVPRAYKAARNAFMWIVYQSGGWAVDAYNWSAETIHRLRQKSSGQLYKESGEAITAAKNYIGSLKKMAQAYVVNNALRRIAEAKGRRVPTIAEEMYVAMKARAYCLKPGENTKDLIYVGASIYGGRYLLGKTIGAAKILRGAKSTKSGVKAKASTPGEVETGAIKWLAKDAVFSRAGPLTPFLEFYKSAKRYFSRGKDVVSHKEKGGVLSSLTGGFARIKKGGRLKIYGQRMLSTGKAYTSVFATEQAVRGAIRDKVPEDIKEVTDWINSVTEKVEMENGQLQNDFVETEQDYLDFESLMP